MVSYCDAALLLKALSDETRLRIVNMLSGEELCACNLLSAFAITQPTLSYHMKILTESGLVKARKDGAWTRYSLNGPEIESLQTFLADLSAGPEDSAACDEGAC